MAKTWSEDNPKAGLMSRKRAALVNAAQQAFLNSGYAEASVNHIAAAAGVSIKTLYRHFESKDELFSAVMQAACGRQPDGDMDASSEPPPAWYALPPAEAFPLAGEDYLRHALSDDQVALYRVVVRDAHRFPELGRRYLEATTGTRDTIFAGYLDLWAGRSGWTIADKRLVAQVFANLLKARIFDDVLFARYRPSEEDIAIKAREASSTLLLLLAAGRF